jgi:hypothetical protein
MLMIAEKRFRRLKAPEMMREVYNGAQYVDGLRVHTDTEEAAA